MRVVQKWEHSVPDDNGGRGQKQDLNEFENSQISAPLGDLLKCKNSELSPLSHPTLKTWVVVVCECVFEFVSNLLIQVVVWHIVCKKDVSWWIMHRHHHCMVTWRAFFFYIVTNQAKYVRKELRVGLKSNVILKGIQLRL